MCFFVVVLSLIKTLRINDVASMIGDAAAIWSGEGTITIDTKIIGLGKGGKQKRGGHWATWVQGRGK